MIKSRKINQQEEGPFQQVGRSMSSETSLQWRSYSTPKETVGIYFILAVEGLDQRGDTS